MIRRFAKLLGLAAVIGLVTGCSQNGMSVAPTTDGTESGSAVTAPLLTDDGSTYTMGGDMIFVKGDPEQQPVVDHLQAAAATSGALAKSESMRFVIIPGWPAGRVPYMLVGFTPAEKVIIAQAMATISAKAKVTYVPVTSAAAGYVYVISKINSTTIGGQSTIGYSQTSYCQLSQVLLPTVIHEFMHGLGFGHEHQRYDRDKYVVINTANIAPGTESQFTKVPQFWSISSAGKTVNYEYSRLMSTYDFASIMHYPKTAFASKYGAITINAGGYSNTIGTAQTLSANDLLALKAAYGAK